MRQSVNICQLVIKSKEHRHKDFTCSSYIWDPIPLTRPCVHWDTLCLTVTYKAPPWQPGHLPRNTPDADPALMELPVLKTKNKCETAISKVEGQRNKSAPRTPRADRT